MNSKLAKITSAGFNFTDRNILILNVFVDYESGESQNVAGIVLSNYDKTLERHVGSSYGTDLLIRILKEFNADNLEDLKGRKCWVICEEKSPFHIDCKGIKALNVDGGKNEILWSDGVTPNE